MSGIYIPGMEMPTEETETIIRIQADGTVLDQYGHHLAITAIPVPDHGRLIDADALPTYDKPIGKMMMFGGEYVYTQTAIDNAPTIIPAEEGEG